MNRYELVKAGIDIGKGIERMGGDCELYEHFLTRFPSDPHYQALLDGIRDKDYQKAFEAAHALKGMTGNLSMDELAFAIYPLVEVLRKGNLNEISPYIEKVQKEYDRVCEAIKAE